VYLLQPDYDCINKCKHYIKSVAGGDDTFPRRHLFYSTREQAWQISPVCHEEEGARRMPLRFFFLFF
jgi:hypothetical protein